MREALERVDPTGRLRFDILDADVLEAAGLRR
jgi:hypothetical protein